MPRRCPQNNTQRKRKVQEQRGLQFPNASNENSQAEDGTAHSFDHGHDCRVTD